MRPNLILLSLCLCKTFIVPPLSSGAETQAAATPATASPVANSISVKVGPSSASVVSGTSVGFVASVSGTANTAVTWSLSPALGSVINGVYTAPKTIDTAQTVTLAATSVADPSKTATATIDLKTTPNNATTASTLTMPLEVIGPNGTTVSASVVMPTGANLTGQLHLWLKIHGLRTQTQASVQVNGSGWMAISGKTVKILGNGAAYGGIGGGFSTLTMSMNLPTGSVLSGANTISFRFNQTDGRVSGFRVLAFNFIAANGSSLLPSSMFVMDNPNNWQPPLNDAADIAAGQSLWRTAPLTTPLTGGGSKTILAHCSDCHAQDGRDLKYFNYSNNSIQSRALFHGLTAQQGLQIASYIRSLNVVNPGRPWNPPYQPGPGLDSLPVSSWAAGAGLSAVVSTDQQTINAIFPSGIQSSVFAPTSRLNQREIPIDVQLPDWNQWLPGTHPMDAYGSAFTSNGFYTVYQTLASTLQPNNAAVYVAQSTNLQTWFNAFYGFYNTEGTPMWSNSALWTPASVDALYSIPQWGMVKTWELMQENQLEGFSQNIFGPQADPRAWYSNQPFFTSPHELKMPNAGTPGLRNGTAAVYNYLSFVWYHLQLILNDSNGQQSYQFPIDWPYSYAFIESLGGLLSPQGGIQTLWMLKGLEVMQELGKGPQLAGVGWQPPVAQPSWLVTPEWNNNVWSSVTPATRTAIANGIVTSWLAQVNQFTPQQFYTGGWTTATAVPVAGGNAYDGVFPDWVWYMIPRFKFIGVDQTVVSGLAQWAQTIWPNANWTADLNATCSWATSSPPNYIINCSQ